jgi:hypothetical protein
LRLGGAKGVHNLIVDGCLFAVIIAGLVLTIVYLKAEYALHIRSKAAQRAKELSLRDLQTTRVRFERNGIPVHVRIARETTQPQLIRTIRFLSRHSHSARQHRAN